MRITKLLFSIVTLGVILSSCLGSDDNTIEVKTPTFAYIQSYNNSLIAAVAGINNMYITSKTLSYSASHDDCVFVTFKTQHGATSNGIYGVEITSITEPLLQEPIVKVSEMPVLENQVYPTSFSVKTFHPQIFLGDRWLFNATFNLKDEEIVEPRFFYNTDNQIEYDYEGNPRPVDKNQGIIDVRFVIVNPNENEETTKKTVIRNDIVGDFSNLRVDKFLPLDEKPTSSVSVNFPLKFRYTKLSFDSRGDEILQTEIIGSWNTSTSTSYGITFVANEY